MLSAKQNWLTYLDAYVEDALVVMRGQQITVELKFDKATAAWAKGPHLASQPADNPTQERATPDDAPGGRHS
jgi:hypothetical protein